MGLAENLLVQYRYLIRADDQVPWVALGESLRLFGGESPDQALCAFPGMWCLVDGGGCVGEWESEAGEQFPAIAGARGEYEGVHSILL